MNKKPLLLTLLFILLGKTSRVGAMLGSGIGSEGRLRPIGSRAAVPLGSLAQYQAAQHRAALVEDYVQIYSDILLWSSFVEKVGARIRSSSLAQRCLMGDASGLSEALVMVFHMIEQFFTSFPEMADPLDPVGFAPTEGTGAAELRAEVFRILASQAMVESGLMAAPIPF